MLSILVVTVCVAVVSAGGFSDGEKRDILAVHNQLRSKVALGYYVTKGNQLPSAANMYALQWDSQLEKSAQNWSDHCISYESSGTDGVGENKYSNSAMFKLNITGNGKDAANAWANQFQEKGWWSIHMTPDLLKSGIKSATQMVWANTHSIGCGSTLCEGGYMVLVICQYAPAGNIIGQDIYKAGKPCSGCPGNCQGSSGLCI